MLRSVAFSIHASSINLIQFNSIDIAAFRFELKFTLIDIN